VLLVVVHTPDFMLERLKVLLSGAVAGGIVVLGRLVQLTVHALGHVVTVVACLGR